jgi:membrane protein implicated in regulation of membrane protease activity
MITAIYSWLIVALVFLILEMGHPGLFFFLSFFIGSLSSAAISYAGYDLTAQLIIFLSSTILSLAILRLFLRSFESPAHQTNADALVAKKAVVLKTIGAEDPGYVKVEGQIWLARSLHKKIIKENQIVIIRRVQGAHVLVEEQS